MPEEYEIIIANVIQPAWADWFDGLRVTPGKPGTTRLCGPLPDQAALHGVLAKIRDLGLTLVSIQQVAADAAKQPTDPDDSYFMEEP